MDDEQRERMTIIVLGEATTSAKRAKRAAPVLIVLAVLLYITAFGVGVQHEWKMDDWTSGTRTAPLWFLLPATFALASGLIIFAITMVRAKTRELREAIARVENDHT